MLFEKGNEVLSVLSKLPVKECPCDMTLERRLRLAQCNVENHNADLENINPELVGANGRFKTPEQLLRWLIDNKPSEELSVTHGDFCLPNIIVCENKVGIIDFPFGGIADKYSDIALFYRSVKSNLGGKYGGKVYGELDEKLFFDILGITPRFDKIEFYILLNELF
ncbi:MAG: phosphotransferase [Firmicutes bacterium]|nr:phosphotransferase [Bacillota bacterium]